MKKDDDRPRIDRRTFMAGGTTAMAAIAAGLTGAPAGFIEKMLHTNFREISPERMQHIISEMEQEYTAKYGKMVTVSTQAAQPGVLFGYGLDSTLR